VEDGELLPEDPPVCLLAEDGTYTPDERFPLDLDTDDLAELLRQMIVTRRLDREFVNLQRQGQLGVYPSCLGQEAAQVGSAAALGPDDWIFPQYRELGCAVVRDLPPEELGHLWRGTWLSTHDPYRYRFALLSIPIGTHALHAVGLGMGAKLAGDPIVVASYFGDGATSGGDPHEAMNFAAVYDAPVLFFVQNNGWAISVPIEQQTSAPTLAHKAIGYGMPGYRLDGNDILATYAVTRRVVAEIRAGRGPAFIEAITYRMDAHTTSDDPGRYRDAEELDRWRARDPIDRLRRHLADHLDAWDSDRDAEADAEAHRATTRLREAIYDAPVGDPTELFEHVFVTPTAHLAEQRREVQADLERRDE
jgi:2-oxoisovalerate dehydrogenase E1 component alpha subunit